MMSEHRGEGVSPCSDGKQNLRNEIEFVSAELHGLGYSAQIMALEALPANEMLGVLECIFLLISDRKVC